jgi:hypothetical protein
MVKHTYTKYANKFSFFVVALPPFGSGDVLGVMKINLHPLGRGEQIDFRAINNYWVN